MLLTSDCVFLMTRVGMVFYSISDVTDKLLATSASLASTC